MKQIKLTQGKFALVDDDNFERVNQYKWCYKVSKKLSNGEVLGYAVHGFWDSKRKQNKVIKLHRFILDLKDPKIIVDHINHNTLDCRRSNLRTVTMQQSNINRRSLMLKTKGKYKGVFWDKKESVWRCEIMINRKAIWLGRYKSEKEAARIYNQKAQELFGEYAFLNKI